MEEESEGKNSGQGQEVETRDAPPPLEIHI